MNDLLKEIEGRVCTLTLHRPEKRNSLSPNLLKSIYLTLKELKQEDYVRAIIIRGNGDKAFCAGYDLSMLNADEKSQEDEDGLQLFEDAMEAIVNFPYPVIAMMNGYAFGGGCDLAVSCDIRIGADNTKIGMVPAKLGVVYSAAGLKRFTRVLGQARTRELFFTGRTYSASFLKEIGFLNYVLPQKKLTDFTFEMAREIASNAPLSLKGIKEVLGYIEKAVELSPEVLSSAAGLARQSFLSEDFKEGQAAFFEKRQPNFKGS